MLCDGVRPLVSVHVAKAGGSSVGSLLSTAYGNSFLGDYSDNPANPLSRRVLDPTGYLTLNQTLPTGIACIHGHFHPGKYELPRNVVLCTMLREPVDNILSIFWFWKTLARDSDPLHSYFLDNNLSITSMAKLPILRRLFSETYFGGFDMTRFDIVGKHAEREAVLTRLSQKIGLPLNVSVHENATPISDERQMMLADPSLRRELEDILTDDLRFYERFTR